MKITAEPTDILTTYNGAPARVWKAKTEGGVEFLLMAAGVAVPEGHPPEHYREFYAALAEVGPPRELTVPQVFDLRLVT